MRCRGTVWSRQFSVHVQASSVGPFSNSSDGLLLSRCEKLRDSVNQTVHCMTCARASFCYQAVFKEQQWIIAFKVWDVEGQCEVDSSLHDFCTCRLLLAAPVFKQQWWIMSFKAATVEGRFELDYSLQTSVLLLAAPVFKVRQWICDLFPTSTPQQIPSIHPNEFCFCVVVFLSVFFTF